MSTAQGSRESRKEEKKRSASLLSSPPPTGAMPKRSKKKSRKSRARPLPVRRQTLLPVVAPRHRGHNSLVCGGCHALLGGGRAVLTSEGVRYHQGCFRCSACGNSLVGSPSVLRLQRRLMCSACSARFAPACAGCRRSIRDPEFLYLAPAYYHADHLTCQGCGDPEIASRGLLAFGGGGPLCAYCGLASRHLVCCSCGRLITGRFLRHGERRWHLGCFKCGKCGDPVQLGAQRLCIVSGQLSCQLCCALAAVTAKLTLSVALPSVASLIQNDPNVAAVRSRMPWGQTVCDKVQHHHEQLQQQQCEQSRQQLWQLPCGRRAQQEGSQQLLQAADLNAQRDMQQQQHFWQQKQFEQHQEWQEDQLDLQREHHMQQGLYLQQQGRQLDLMHKQHLQLLKLQRYLLGLCGAGGRKKQKQQDSWVRHRKGRLDR